jgi:hypothetical protein
MKQITLIQKGIGSILKRVEGLANDFPSPIGFKTG